MGVRLLLSGVRHRKIQRCLYPPSLQGRSSREGSPATLVPPCQLIWQCDTLMRLLVYRATEAAAAAYDAHVHHARPHHEPESQCNSNSTAS